MRKTILTLALVWLSALAALAADESTPCDLATVVKAFYCETDDLTFASTSIDTICPGSVFEDPDPGDISVECTSSADATTYSIHCEGSEEILDGCTINFVYDAAGIREGETYMVSGTTTISYVGDCPVVLDSCQRLLRQLHHGR